MTLSIHLKMDLQELDVTLKKLIIILSLIKKASFQLMKKTIVYLLKQITSTMDKRLYSLKHHTDMLVQALVIASVISQQKAYILHTQKMAENMVSIKTMKVKLLALTIYGQHLNHLFQDILLFVTYHLVVIHFINSIKLQTMVLKL